MQVFGLDTSGSIVITLAEGLLDEGRCMITDNYCTSDPLTKFMLSRNTDVCGTVNKKRKGLPKERRREKHSSSTWNVQVQVTPLRKTHFFEFLAKKESRFIRRRCVGCCQNLLNEGRLAPYAQAKAKRVSTQCKICKKEYCVVCFSELLVHQLKFVFFFLSFFYVVLLY